MATTSTPTTRITLASLNRYVFIKPKFIETEYRGIILEKLEIFDTYENKFKAITSTNLNLLNTSSSAPKLAVAEWEAIWNTSTNEETFNQNIIKFYNAADKAIKTAMDKNDKRSSPTPSDNVMADERKFLHAFRVFMNPYHRNYKNNVPQHHKTPTTPPATPTLKASTKYDDLAEDNDTRFKTLGGFNSNVNVSNNITAMAIAFKNMLDVDSNYKNMVVPTLRGGDFPLEKDTALGYLYNRGLKLNSDRLQKIKEMLQVLKNKNLTPKIMDEVNKSFHYVAKLDGVYNALEKMSEKDIKDTDVGELIKKIHNRQNSATDAADYVLKLVLNKSVP